MKFTWRKRPLRVDRWGVSWGWVGTVRVREREPNLWMAKHSGVQFQNACDGGGAAKEGEPINQQVTYCLQATSPGPLSSGRVASRQPLPPLAGFASTFLLGWWVCCVVASGSLSVFHLSYLPLFNAVSCSLNSSLEPATHSSRCSLWAASPHVGGYINNNNNCQEERP